MGRELYANEPVFRATIQQCDSILRELEDVSILPNFEGPLDENIFKDEGLLICTLCSIQVALYDLWRSKGIVPDAILGVSLGESAAMYATGAITVEEAMKLALHIRSISIAGSNDFTPIYLHCSVQDVYMLAEKAPAPFWPVYEAASNGVLVTCYKNQKAQIESFLQQQGIQYMVPPYDNTWAYHTPLLLKDRELYTRYIPGFQLKPLQFDYYSCLTGGHIPKGSIIHSDFWMDVKHTPVRTHAALMASRQMGRQVMLHIGPHPFLKGQILQSGGGVGRDAVLLDSMRKGESETVLIETTHRQIRSYRMRKQTGAAKSDSPTDLLAHLNLNAPHVLQNPYTYLDFLRKQGSVHFLPANNLWLVLDYVQIEQVLKQPELFSSTLHQTFDECLVGSDPPSHTLVRSLLQPLFSQPVLSDLGIFATNYATELAQKLQDRKEFNVVDEFSLPLAQAVVARFMGLSSTEAQDLQQCINGHVYAMAHLDGLYRFFKQHLEKDRAVTNQDDAAALLLAAIEDGSMSFDGAVKLMRLLWIAGMTTTSMLISTSIHLALKDPELKQQLMENDQLITRFIEECLRLEAPEADLKRITTKEVVLDNKTIPAGSIIMLSLAAANRDAAYFPEPGKIILDRPAKRHLSFGGGYHYCLGVGLARLEAKHALKVFLQKLPGARLNQAKPPVYFPSSHFRGLEKLIVFQNL